MARRITRQELKRDEVVEAAVDAGHWVEDHWRTVVAWASALAVVGLAIGGWFWWSSHNRALTEQRLADTLVEFSKLEEAGFADRAAVDSVLGELSEIAERAGNSPPGLVARLAQGSALLQTDRAGEAVPVLEGVVRHAKSTMLAPSHALLASAYRAEGRTDEAIELLRGLVESKDPAVPVDQALIQLAALYQAAGREQEARESYQRILDEHPMSTAAATARKELAS